MSNANPLIPQGSLLERKAKGKPHLRVAYVIVAVHLVFLGGLLIQGCKREDQTKTDRAPTNDTGLAQLASDSLYNTNVGAAAALPGQDIAQTSAPLSTNLATQNLPVPTPVEGPPTREYIVVQHDTFSSIGKKFNVSSRAIARANPGVDPTRMKVGQKLQIPPPPATASTTGALQATLDSGANIYVVKSGDTLSKIAAAHGTTVTEIKSLNGLKTDRINAGDKLKLPPARSTPATTTATSTSTAGITPPLPGPTGNP